MDWIVEKVARAIAAAELVDPEQISRMSFAELQYQGYIAMAQAAIEAIDPADPALRDACKEAMLYLNAPAGSPRHWPVARANLYQRLEKALQQGEDRK